MLIKNNRIRQKCVGEYIQKLGHHIIDLDTELKIGTLGANGIKKDWNVDDLLSETHGFKPKTGNDIFFNDRGFKFHTGMKLNKGQLEDLNKCKKLND